MTRTLCAAPATWPQALARIDELEETVRQLTEELGRDIDRKRRDDISRMGFSPQEATLLALMESRGSRPVSLDLFDEIVPGPDGHHERDAAMVFKVLICNIRKRIGRGSVETVWGRGYRLTDSGRDILRSQGYDIPENAGRTHDTRTEL